MGIGGISIWQLLIILAIVVLLFGTKKLKGIGGDLGGAIKGFKKAVGDNETNTTPKNVGDQSTETSEEETMQENLSTEEKEPSETK